MSFWSENYSFIKDVYDTRVSKMIEWMDHVEMAIQKVRIRKWQRISRSHKCIFNAPPSGSRWWQQRCTRAPSSSGSATTSSPWSRTWRRPIPRSGWMKSRKPYSGQKSGLGITISWYSWIPGTELVTRGKTSTRDWRRWSRSTRAWFPGFLRLKSRARWAPTFP